MELKTLRQTIVQKWKTVKKQACLLWWAIHHPVALILVGFVREMQRPNRDWTSDCVADKKKKSNISYVAKETEKQKKEQISPCLSVFPVWYLTAVKWKIQVLAETFKSVQSWKLQRRFQKQTNKKAVWYTCSSDCYGSTPLLVSGLL